MKVLIMAGGTGGHIMPGLALAAGLRAHGVEVDWLGTERGLESKLVPQNGIALHTIHIAGVRGKGLMTRLLMPMTLLRGVWEAIVSLREIEPQLVFGFGGYAAAPGGLAARLLRIPLFIHEQNARAGSTNRLLSRIASRVFAAYPRAFPTVNPTVEVVGNPVRAEILDVPEPASRGVGARKPFRLLVLGGSQGARVLNTQVPAALALLEPGIRPEVRHQAGRTLDDAISAYAAADLDIQPEAFIDDMPEAYAQADLVICRAGALSLAEIMAVGLPAICVPLPHAIDDHQTANARQLVDAGAGWLLPESELSAESLATLLRDIAAQPDELLKRAEAARSAAIRDGDKRLLASCLDVLGVPA